MQPTCRYRRRRAVLMIAVLASLTLVAILAAVWLRMLAIERQQARAQQSVLQTEYLADSAIARATARLANDANYSGELWEPTAEGLGLSVPAQVTITVAPDKSNPQARAVSVATALGTRKSAKVLRRKQQTILLPTKEQSP